MNLFSTLTRQDYLMIKWQIGYALLGIILSTLIFIGSDYLNAQSLQDLRIARADFDNSRTRVDRIEDEEQTIIEYIGRYQALDNDGVIGDEDRLEMIERVANIRADNNLYVVDLDIDVQDSMNLNYPPEISEPGDPVALHSSVIELDLQLLHEGDLIRLLHGIVDSPGLYQTRDCSISLQNREATSFITLAPNFTASCDVLWYTFDLHPPPPQNPYGF